MDPVPLYMAHALAATASDNSGKITTLIIAVAMLLLFSAFFSATETAYTSSNRIRLRTMENDGSKRAKKILKQLENYDKFITTVLVGNNIVNITATTLAGILFAELIQRQAVAALVSTIVVTLVILIFSEITPKSLAKKYPERFSLFAQPIVSAISFILTPLVLLFGLLPRLFKQKGIAPSVTEGELLTIVEEAEHGGELNSHESKLIRSAIEFDDVELYDIMVPRVDIVAIKDTDTMEKIGQVFADTGFSRLPVYHESLDAIIGIVHEKDYHAQMRAGKDSIMEKIKSSICLSANMKISDALRILQKAKVHMAIVVDEFGGTSGLVTMEDILEELVGEIYDEHDEEEVLLRQIDENTFIVSGAENIEVMFEQIGQEVKEEFDSTTVGGWVTEHLKRIPIVGESFEFNNMKIIITKATTRKVVEVKVIIQLNENDSAESLVGFEQEPSSIPIGDSLK